MEYYIIDRFEKNFAVCETSKGERVLLERDILPSNAKEGSVLRFLNGVYRLDEALEQTLRKANIDLEKRVFGGE